MKLNVQVALPPLPLSTQLALVGETLAPLAVTVKVPVGVGLPPPCVSVTVTVQLLEFPTAIGLVQVTLVDVVRPFTVMDPLPALVPCVESPA